MNRAVKNYGFSNGPSSGSFSHLVGIDPFDARVGLVLITVLGMALYRLFQDFILDVVSTSSKIHLRALSSTVKAL